MAHYEILCIQIDIYIYPDSYIPSGSIKPDFEKLIVSLYNSRNSIKSSPISSPLERKTLSIPMLINGECPGALHITYPQGFGRDCTVPHFRSNEGQTIPVY